MHGIVVVLVAGVVAFGCGNNKDNTSSKSAPTTKPVAVAKAGHTGKSPIGSVTPSLPTATGVRSVTAVNYLIVTDADVKVGQNLPQKTTVPLRGTNTSLDKLATWLDSVRAAYKRPPGLMGKKESSEGAMKKRPPRARGQYQMEKQGAATVRPDGILSTGAASPLRSLTSRTEAFDDSRLDETDKLQVMVWGRDETAPLLLADKSLPAKRIVKVIGRLCSDGAHLAVAGTAVMPARRRHQVNLGTYEGVRCKPDRNPDRPDTSYRVSGGVSGVAIELAAHNMKISVDGVVHDIGDYKDVNKTVASLNKVTRRNIMMRVFVAVTNDLDVQTMVRALDVFARVGMQHVHLGVDFGRAKRGAAERNARYKIRIGSTVRLGTATVKGSLDRAIVRRYVNRNKRRLKACHERQLLVTPAIKGTMQSSFTITATGYVIKATATGVHTNVSGCVAQVLSRMAFPKPKGKDSVTVKYPFTFSVR